MFYLCAIAVRSYDRKFQINTCLYVCVVAQIHQHSLQQMQDCYQRREAALDYHRREYERTHPQHQQQQQQRQRQRPIYQTDSALQLDLDEDGEDEID